MARFWITRHPLDAAVGACTIVAELSGGEFLVSDSPEYRMDVDTSTVRPGYSHIRSSSLAGRIASEMGVELDDRVGADDGCARGYVLMVTATSLTLLPLGHRSEYSPVLFWLDWGGAAGGVDVSLGQREVEVFRWLGPAV